MINGITISKSLTTEQQSTFNSIWDKETSQLELNTMLQKEIALNNSTTSANISASQLAASQGGSKYAGFIMLDNTLRELSKLSSNNSSYNILFDNIKTLLPQTIVPNISQTSIPKLESKPLSESVPVINIDNSIPSDINKEKEASIKRNPTVEDLINATSITKSIPIGFLLLYNSILTNKGNTVSTPENNQTSNISSLFDIPAGSNNTVTTAASTLISKGASIGGALLTGASVAIGLNQLHKAITGSANPDVGETSIENALEEGFSSNVSDTSVLTNAVVNAGKFGVIGAKIGSLVAPGVGTAVGAIIGAGAGVVSQYLIDEQHQDELMQWYLKNNPDFMKKITDAPQPEDKDALVKAAEQEKINFYKEFRDNFKMGLDDEGLTVEQSYNRYLESKAGNPITPITTSTTAVEHNGITVDNTTVSGTDSGSNTSFGLSDIIKNIDAQYLGSSLLDSRVTTDESLSSNSQLNNNIIDSINQNLSAYNIQGGIKQSTDWQSQLEAMRKEAAKAGDIFKAESISSILQEAILQRDTSLYTQAITNENITLNAKDLQKGRGLQTQDQFNIDQWSKNFGEDLLGISKKELRSIFGDVWVKDIDKQISDLQNLQTAGTITADQQNSLRDLQWQKIAQDAISNIAYSNYQWKYLADHGINLKDYGINESQLQFASISGTDSNNKFYIYQNDLYDFFAGLEDSVDAMRLLDKTSIEDLMDWYTSKGPQYIYVPKNDAASSDVISKFNLTDNEKARQGLEPIKNNASENPNDMISWSEIYEYLFPGKIKAIQPDKTITAVDDAIFNLNKTLEKGELFAPNVKFNPADDLYLMASTNPSKDALSNSINNLNDIMQKLLIAINNIEMLRPQTTLVNNQTVAYDLLKA